MLHLIFGKMLKVQHGSHAFMGISELIGDSERKG